MTVHEGPPIVIPEGKSMGGRKGTLGGGWEILEPLGLYLKATIKK